MNYLDQMSLLYDEIYKDFSHHMHFSITLATLEKAIDAMPCRWMPRCATIGKKMYGSGKHFMRAWYGGVDPTYVGGAMAFFAPQ